MHGNGHAVIMAKPSPAGTYPVCCCASSITPPLRPAGRAADPVAHDHHRPVGGRPGGCGVSGRLGWVEDFREARRVASARRRERLPGCRADQVWPHAAAIPAGVSQHLAGPGPTVPMAA